MRRKLPLVQILYRKLNYYPYLKENCTISKLRLAITICIFSAFVLCYILRFSSYQQELSLINPAILFLLLLTCFKISFQKFFVKQTQVIFAAVVLLGTHLSIAGLVTVGPLHGLAIDYFASLTFFVILIPIVAGLSVFFTCVCGVITLITFNSLFSHSTDTQVLFSKLILVALTMIACILVQMLSVLSKRDRIQALYRQREIAKVKRNNDQLQLSDAVKNKLLYIISHNLRGPIASIKGIINLYNTNVISRDEFNGQTAKLNDLLQHTNTMLDNLLYWSILESEKTLNYTECNLFEMVEGILHSMVNQAQKKKIVLENNVPRELMMRVDSPLMHLTLLNIISNAVKFTDTGKVAVQAYFSASAICFEITDTGHGMDNHEVSKLFDWERIGNSTGTHIGRGPGLGLLLCKEFMKQHDGDIVVGSIKYKGTTVIVSLPTSLVIPARRESRTASTDEEDPIALAEFQNAK